MISSAINSKRAAFRNEIRQKQLDSFFNMKRRLLFSEENMEVEHHSFKIIFQEILQSRNVQQNLMVLNGLAFQRQLSTQFLDQAQSDQMYYDIVQYLTNLILQHPQSNNQHANKRIVCLNTIANMLSDNHSPNSSLANIICQLLKEFYECVGICGSTFQLKQVIEIGFVIGNLISNPKFGEEADQACISFLFQWIQDILHIKQQQKVIESLYFGLKIIVIALQNRYKLSNLELPQLFQGQILNFIETTIKNEQIFDSVQSGLYISAANFMYHMVPVFFSICPFEWSFQFITRLTKFFTTVRKNLLTKICMITKRFLLFSDINFTSRELFQRAIQIRNKGREIIADNLFSKMLWLTMDDQVLKQLKFDMILCVIECDQTNSAYYLDRLIECKIQMYMINVLGLKNQELHIMFFQLVNIAKRLKMEEHFRTFLEAAEKLRLKNFQQTNQ